jgi:hypothetical protein
LDCTSNSIHRNTALTNHTFDLGDLNPACDGNAWSDNHEYATDHVAGGPDGRPGAGCIQ